MDDILGLGRPAAADGGKRLKDLARTLWDLAEDETVMVSELRCHEDGCPDVETVVAVLSGPGGTRQVKIAKPMADVTAEDLGPRPA